MATKIAELTVPPGAYSDPQSVEMLRAWVANGGLQCTLNVGAWSENEAIGWGVLLSDAARHIADALKQKSGIDPQTTLAEIKRVFDEELDSPTAPTEGSFIQ